MEKSRFSEEQIIGFIKQAEACNIDGIVAASVEARRLTVSLPNGVNMC